MEKISYSTILITGASTGLGKALALSFAEPGLQLFLSGRNLEALEATGKSCREKGAAVEIEQVDVTSSDEVERWVKGISDKTNIDLAIANAGVLDSHGPDRQFESADKALKQFDTNLGGSVRFIASVVPHMQKQKRGQIGLICSMSALQPIADMPAYAASKAGLVAYGEAISHYLHDDGIGISVICPGFVKTAIAGEFVSWRPLEISADRAAALTKRAILQRKAFSAFPLLLYWVILIGRIVPWRFRRLTTKAFNYKR
ncbi:SDR family oxidoreductase [Roseibium sp. MMSF_3544]|uniref:SDR family NAD(P)-dependent oxidoreductase n=1 Tax=unclassified Roseibium TaxID=2629323 RepID=UPI00273E3A6D|nr:SDR family NAD(P)-dependent oxidoreductase [Roseibium sp. MMSF_3544]